MRVIMTAERVIRGRLPASVYLVETPGGVMVYFGRACVFIKMNLRGVPSGKEVTSIHTLCDALVMADSRYRAAKKRSAS